MPRKCRQCGQGTGPNRRLCTDCEREARDTYEPSTPLETTAGDGVGAWICVNGTWHASIEFDGFHYDFACGDGFDDFPAEDVTHSHHALDHESVCADCRAAIDPESIPDPWADVIGDDADDGVSLREGETREDSGHTSVVNQTLADADDEYLEQIAEDPEQYRCDGGNETAQQTLGGDTLESDDDSETSEDYTFTRSQCRAITNAGERCSNPVRRTDGESEFCPRHHDTDCETIDDRLATDGGTELPTLETDDQPVDHAGTPVPPEYDGVDLRNDGCPVCGCLTFREERAGYYGCDDCLNVWAGDPENASIACYVGEPDEVDDEQEVATDGGQEHTHYCEDCEMKLALLYDDRDDETTPIVCGHCGGTNTRPLEDGQPVATDGGLLEDQQCQDCEDAPATEVVQVTIGGVPAGPLYVCDDCASDEEGPDR
ncbi:hypothetical protein A6E15_19345 [Natrinema saccharevitans]|uniref:Uncharacterized protein n=1 Tax=Natrinema saccharevitans TaxID=301967 RepID=A0A1S8AR29_9EURY|nr:hypothetical protein [Natrinema saccharevitans]OLZ39120.1 hypothetical protein A6E15_19345 [Natrinema saccharevitans]